MVSLRQLPIDGPQVLRDPVESRPRGHQVFRVVSALGANRVRTDTVLFDQSVPPLEADGGSVGKGGGEEARLRQPDGRGALEKLVRQVTAQPAVVAVALASMWVTAPRRGGGGLGLGPEPAAVPGAAGLGNGWVY